MTDQSSVGIFATLAQAEAAVRKLDQGRFPIKQGSIVAQNLETEKEVHGFIKAGDVAKTGAGTGAWVGGIFGLLMGGVFLVVPGFGPVVVAGSLAAALLGGAEGATFGAAGGGVLGALVGWGVSREHVVKYEDHLKGGRYLLIACGSAEEVARERDILQDSAALEVNSHADGLSARPRPLAPRADTHAPP